MIQLYCPACENVVWIEGNQDEEVAPCPECQEPINLFGRRQGRPLSAPSVSSAQSFQGDAHVVAAPAVETAADLGEDANWRSAEEQDFSLPCPEPLPRFVALPYRAEGGFSARRLPLFFAFILLGGMALGVLASILGQVCYVILLYPLALGLGMAGITILAAHLGHVRSPQLAGLAALAGGFLCVLTMHFLDYRQTMALVASEPARLPRELLSPLRTSSGFLDYLDATASLGVTISGPDNGGLNLGRTGSYLYWLSEFVLVMLIAVVGGAGGARDPYCASCRVWKGDRFLGTIRDTGPEMFRAVARGNLATLECCRPAPAGGELVLTASVCPRCGHDCPVDLRIEHNPKARTEPVSSGLPVHLTFPGEALNVLEATFACSERH